MDTPATDNAVPADRQLLALVQQVAQQAHPGESPTVTPHTSFERDLGLDSLARVELLQRASQHFGIELPAQALSDADTPQQLLRYLERAAPLPLAASDMRLPASQAVGFPGQAETLLDVLEWHVARQPDNLHILLRDEQQREQPIRYRDLLDAAHAIAGGLVAHGLQPRQPVALMLPTGRDYLASFFGVLLAGGIPVPIYPPARSAQLEDHLRRHARILANAEAALLVTVEQAKRVALMLQAAVPTLAAGVTPAELRARAGVALRYRPQGSDIAFLQYTSGSTGDPKGVVLTHANLLANVRALGKAARAGPGDVFVSWLPLYHDMGLIGAWLGSLYHGLPLVLMSPLAFLARPALWLQTIAAHRGTISAAPNFAYELCVRHVSDAALGAADLSCWRLALNGAEPVSAATLEAFARRFARYGLRRTALTPVYGLAESAVGLAFPPAGRGPRIDQIDAEAFARERKAVPASGTAATTLHIPSCGAPLPGHEIRIVGDAGFELPERCVGRLEFRGPSATAGYYRNPQATRALLHGGWLDSGDYAYMAAGEVHVTGRVKDLIKRGGRNLYPYDLEQAAGNLPGIRKGCVAVFASPDPATRSERLVVLAETRERDAGRRAELRAALNRSAVDVAGCAADDIVLVPPHTIPKTSSGKLRRLACRDAYEHGQLAQHRRPPWLDAPQLAATLALARVRLAGRHLAAWAYGIYAWFVFAAIALPCGTLIIALRQPPLGRRIARGAARILFRLTGVPLSATGLEHLPLTAHVLLLNHSSYLDAVALTALLPATPGYAFAAKREFAALPVMGALLRGLGTLFVERADVQRSSEGVDLMATALKRGENLLVFPEGTFSREAGLKPFHSGAFLAAAKAGAPLVAGGLRGTRAALRADSWLPQCAALALAVGQARLVTSSNWSATVQAASNARAEMAALCGEFIPG